MSGLLELKLNENEKNALKELKEKLNNEIFGVQIILYGSKARGDDRELSDIDLLILIDEEMSEMTADLIRNIAYSMELKHDIILSIMIESKKFWDSPLAIAMPFHENVHREGIIL